MDQLNPYETRATFKWHRAEYLVLFAVLLVLFVMHIGEVRWLPAVALFVYIDLIGYIPGAIAYHRSPTKKISGAYFVLYNIMHSMITQTLVVVGWVLLFGWEWALLVIPLHLAGDRGMFGNFLKPLNSSFEPVAHPAYLKLRAALESEPDSDPVSAVPVSAASPAATR